MQLLTLVPSSWSIERTKSVFGVTGYMVKESRKLKIENGASIQPLQTVCSIWKKSAIKPLKSSNNMNEVQSTPVNRTTFVQSKVVRLSGVSD